jgi:hypothetical protein
MTQHTQGPWIIHRADEYTDDAGDHSKIMSITAQNGQTILYTDSGYFKPREEDARLIAAAPELLEALKQAVDLLRSYDATGTWPVQIAAIAKAEGRA